MAYFRLGSKKLEVQSSSSARARLLKNRLELGSARKIQARSITMQQCVMSHSAPLKFFNFSKHGSSLFCGICMQWQKQSDMQKTVRFHQEDRIFIAWQSSHHEMLTFLRALPIRCTLNEVLFWGGSSQYNRKRLGKLGKQLFLRWSSMKAVEHGFGIQHYCYASLPSRRNT